MLQPAGRAQPTTDANAASPLLQTGLPQAERQATLARLPAFGFGISSHLISQVVNPVR